MEALAARGAPEVALAVQRCRGMPPADLRQAQTLADVRLAEGLLTEAVVEVGHWNDSGTRNCHYLKFAMTLAKKRLSEGLLTEAVVEMGLENTWNKYGMHKREIDAVSTDCKVAHQDRRAGALGN